MAEDMDLWERLNVISPPQLSSEPLSRVRQLRQPFRRLMPSMTQETEANADDKYYFEEIDATTLTFLPIYKNV